MKRLALPTCHKTALFGSTLILSAMLALFAGCLHTPKEYEVDEQGRSWSLLTKPLRIRVCPPHAKLPAQADCPTLRFASPGYARFLATGLTLAGEDRVYLAVASENAHCLSGCKVRPTVLTFHLQDRTLRSGPCQPLAVFNQQDNDNTCFDASCSLAGLVYDAPGMRLLALRPEAPARLYEFPLNAERCPDGSVRAYPVPVTNTRLLRLMILADEPRLTLALFGEKGFFEVYRFQDGTLSSVPTPEQWRERLLHEAQRLDERETSELFVAPPKNSFP